MKRRREKAQKVIELDYHNTIWIALSALAAVLAIICTVRLVRSFSKVSEFEVTGASGYEIEEIISASGVRKGDKLYSVDEEKVAKRIKTECPYISEVTLECKFPDTLRIDVECYVTSWYVEIEGDYYSLNSELRVLEETANSQKFIDGGITKLTLPNIKSAVVGTTLVFGNDDAEREFAYEFMNMINRTTFKSRLTLVDIDNRFDVNIGIDGVIEVYMGSGASADEKLRAVEKALGDKKLENCISAKIDVSSPSAVYIKPVYNYSTEGEG